MAILSRVQQVPSRLRRVTTSRDYIPQIDGLRLLALVPVLVWHAAARATRFYEVRHTLTPMERSAFAWLPDGRAGVILFFFISGYVISYPFLAGRAPTLGAFYKRRLYRLEPPYILMLIVAFLLVSIGGAPANAPTFQTNVSLWQSFVASLVYLHGLLFHLNPRLLPPAWSLEIECQFYLISPALLWAYCRIGSFKARICTAAVATGSTIILTNVLEAWLGDHGAQRWLLTAHFHAFAAGIVTCDFALRTRPASAEPSLRFDFGLGAGLLLLAAVGIYTEVPLSTPHRIMRDAATVPAVVLVYLGAMRGTWSRKALGEGWTALLGGMCYSIYLVHVPLMHITATILYRVVHPGSLLISLAIGLLTLIPVALIGGFLFYLGVERPCMMPDWPSRLRRRLSARSRLNLRADSV